MTLNVALGNANISRMIFQIDNFYLDDQSSQSWNRCQNRVHGQHSFQCPMTSLIWKHLSLSFMHCQVTCWQCIDCANVTGGRWLKWHVNPPVSVMFISGFIIFYGNNRLEESRNLCIFASISPLLIPILGGDTKWMTISPAGHDSPIGSNFSNSRLASIIPLPVHPSGFTCSLHRRKHALGRTLWASQIRIVCPPLDTLGFPMIQNLTPAPVS